MAEPGMSHHLPHFHAVYQGWSASFDIDSLAVLGGKLPTTQRRLVEAWAELHRQELLENWVLLHSGQPSFKIKPLI